MEKNYIIRPVVTEKTVANGGENKFTFLVTHDANKVEIKKQLTQAYGVAPEKVNIVILPAKERSLGRRTVQKRKEHKRAIVSFPKGSTIDIFKVKSSKTATKEKTSTSN